MLALRSLEPTRKGRISLTHILVFEDQYLFGSYFILFLGNGKGFLAGCLTGTSQGSHGRHQIYYLVRIGKDDAGLNAESMVNDGPNDFFFLSDVKKEIMFSVKRKDFVRHNLFI